MKIYALNFDMQFWNSLRLSVLKLNIEILSLAIVNQNIPI